MLTGMSNLLLKTKPKRRWLQFSMRTMLVIVSVSCVVLAVWVVSTERRRRDIGAIEALGGTVRYVGNDGKSKSFPAAFLRRWLPPVYFDQVELVDLSGSSVTDAGLAHLERLSGLEELYLDSTQITDDGLAHLEGLTALQCLILDDTQITDAGLGHLKGLTALKCLVLANTQVTDAGLAHLQGLIALQELYLINVQITDVGLAHLDGLTALQWLLLDNTQVTDDGLVQLRKALPKCRIDGP